MYLTCCNTLTFRAAIFFDGDRQSLKTSAYKGQHEGIVAGTVSSCPDVSE